MSSPSGCFAVGTGRCGSTLLSSMLREHPEILSLSEFLTVLGGPRALVGAAVSGDQFAGRINVVSSEVGEFLRAAPDTPELLWPSSAADRSAEPSPLLLAPLPHLCEEPGRLLGELTAAVLRRPVATPAQQLAWAFDWLLERFGRRIWVERSGGSAEYLKDLQRGWPEARFVYLVRDGPECALSMSRHPAFRVRVARMVARDENLAMAECLARDLPIAAFGMYWSMLMLRTAEADGLADPRRTLVVSYESLLERPGRELARLSRFLGLSADVGTWTERVLRKIRPRSDRWGELAASERERLERACRPGMRVRSRLLPLATAGPVRDRVRVPCAG